MKNKKISAVKGKTSANPKANFSDELLTYSCSRLSSVCTFILRQDGLDDEAVSAACSKAIVCSTVASSFFQYYGGSSLADRVAALQELSACCSELIAALEGKEFEGSLDLLTAAQNCLEQCKETSGEVEEDETLDSTAAVPVSAKASNKVSAKRRNPGWLTVKAAATEEGQETYSINIDGVIGESIDDDTQVASKEFKNALAKIPKGKSIDLYIKSPGGSCLDGYAIYSALQERKEDVTVHVIAALSIASIIALGGSGGGGVLTSRASQWMIHAPLAGTYGNEKDHADSIKMLKSFGSTMADVYAAHSGLSKDECLAMMKEETWLSGSEAVEMGFADGLDQDADEEEVSASCQQMITACRQEIEPRYAVAAYYTPTKSISASTNAVGKTAGPAASQKTENMNKTETTPVAAAPAVSLEQRFLQERTMRVTSEINRRAQGKIKNDQLAWWTQQAMDAPTAEAEQAVYAQLESLPVAAAPGAEAVRPDNNGASVEARTPVFEVAPVAGCMPRANKRLDWMGDIRKQPSAQARAAALKKDWQGRLNYCIEMDARENKGTLPVAANSYSATLITDFLVDTAVTILMNRWAALSSFGVEFSPDRYKEYSTAQIKYVTGAGTTLRGTKSSPITNFQQGDGTIVPITVPMTHYVKSFNTSQEDLMSGLRIENLMTRNLGQLADDVTTDALQPIAGAAANTQIPGPLNSSGAVTNFSAGTIHINAGTFGWNAGATDGHDLASLWGYLKKSPEKNLILDGNFYGRLTNSPGFFQPTFGNDEKGGGDRIKTFGWDRLEENTAWPAITDAAGNAIGGFACNKQAIIGVTGLPQTFPNVPGAVFQETIVTLPGPDISISMFTWFELAARKLWNSFELMGGFAGGDATAGAVIFNGKGSVS